MWICCAEIHYNSFDLSFFVHCELRTELKAQAGAAEIVTYPDGSLLHKSFCSCVLSIKAHMSLRFSLNAGGQMVWEAGLRGSWCHMSSETLRSESFFAGSSLSSASALYYKHLAISLTSFCSAGGRFNYFQTGGWALGWSQTRGKSWILSSAVLGGKLLLWADVTDVMDAASTFINEIYPFILRRSEAESPSVKSCRVCSCSLACDCGLLRSARLA